MKITGKNMSEYSTYDDYMIDGSPANTLPAVTGHYTLQFDTGVSLQVSKEQFDSVNVDDNVLVEVNITKV